MLVPEVSFEIDAFLLHLRNRIEARGHAVVVVAEGAGQELFEAGDALDASGNRRLGDIGMLLKERIAEHFADAPLSIRYVDPGYAIRSVPANAYDAVYCARRAQAAVHAAMAGFTSTVVGRWHGRFIHLPIAMATLGPQRGRPAR